MNWPVKDRKTKKQKNKNKKQKKRKRKKKKNTREVSFLFEVYGKTIYFKTSTPFTCLFTIVSSTVEFDLFFLLL